MEDIKDEIQDKYDLSIIDKEFRWNYFRNKRGKELVSYVNDSVLKQFQDKYNDRDIFQSLFGPLFAVSMATYLEIVTSNAYESLKGGFG